MPAALPADVLAFLETCDDRETLLDIKRLVDTQLCRLRAVQSVDRLQAGAREKDVLGRALNLNINRDVNSEREEHTLRFTFERMSFLRKKGGFELIYWTSEGYQEEPTQKQQVYRRFKYILSGQVRKTLEEDKLNQWCGRTGLSLGLFCQLLQTALEDDIEHVQGYVRSMQRVASGDDDIERPHGATWREDSDTEDEEIDDIEADRQDQSDDKYDSEDSFINDDSVDERSSATSSEDISNSDESDDAGDEEADKPRKRPPRRRRALLDDDDDDDNDDYDGSNNDSGDSENNQGVGMVVKAIVEDSDQDGGDDAEDEGEEVDDGRDGAVSNGQPEPDVDEESDYYDYGSSDDSDADGKKLQQPAASRQSSEKQVLADSRVTQKQEKDKQQTIEPSAKRSRKKKRKKKKKEVKEQITSPRQDPAGERSAQWGRKRRRESDIQSAPDASLAAAATATTLSRHRRKRQRKHKKPGKQVDENADMAEDMAHIKGLLGAALESQVAENKMTPSKKKKKRKRKKKSKKPA